MYRRHPISTADGTSSKQLQEMLKRLQTLRRSYTRQTLHQRLKVIEDRLKSSRCGPNLLVANVSALEALARYVLVNHRFQAEEADLRKLYQEEKDTNAHDLLKKLVRGRVVEIEPSQLDEINVANKYRNFLIHECSFVRQDYSRRLIKAVKATIKSLKKFASTGSALPEATDPGGHRTRKEIGY